MTEPAETCTGDGKQSGYLKQWLKKLAGYLKQWLKKPDWKWVVGTALIPILGLLIAWYGLIKPRQIEREEKISEAAVLLEGNAWGETTQDPENIKKARSILDAVLRRDDDNPRALLYRGLVYRLGNAQQAAREYYERAIGEDQKLAEAHLFLGVLEIEAGNITKGRAHIEDAAKLKPNNALIQLDLGIALLINGDTADAEEAFERVLEQRPLESRAISGLASVYARDGEYGEAVRYYKQALAEDSDNPVLYRNLGSVLYLQGELDAAEVALRKVLSLRGGEDRGADDLLDEIERERQRQDTETEEQETAAL